jgi:hypothetical protein
MDLERRRETNHSHLKIEDDGNNNNNNNNNCYYYSKLSEDV